MKQILAGLLLALVALLLQGVPPEPLNDDGNYFPYRAILKIAPGHLPLNQGNIGTCVAVAHKGAIDCSNAVDVVLGRLREFLPVSAESIYGGARNEAIGKVTYSRGDGANGYNAAKWLAKVGGVLYEKDLGPYSVSRAKDWGATSNGGDKTVNGTADKKAAEHQVAATVRITSLEELDVSLKNGKFTTICSNVGFNSPRDKDGFCQPRGSWSHCMLVIGKRNEGRKGYLIQNSWGAYIPGDGPNSSNKYKDQPDGSFYIEPRVMQRILDAGDSWSFSNQDDFKGELPDWMLDASAEASVPDPISTPDAVPLVLPDETSKTPIIDGLLDIVNVDLEAKPKAAATQSRCGPQGCPPAGRQHAPRRRFLFR